MFSKKQLVLTSFILAILFHFLFYIAIYGPTISLLNGNLLYLPALLSAAIMIFVYLGTYWRRDLKGSKGILLYDLLIVWISICFIRSLLDMKSANELVPFLFYNYLGIALFPVFFLIAGVKESYYRLLNSFLIVYFVFAAIISLFFLEYFELQVFLLMPVFYLILLIPQTEWKVKAIIFLVSLGIIIISMTNRAGILRILISYSILLAMYVMQTARIHKRLLQFIVFLILMIPLVSLYYGIKGQNVFEVLPGKNDQPYSQFDPYADTRTLLYYEVFQDLRQNNAFIFGKGLNATYASESFQTLGRPMVEVGFLQVLMKTGILGVLLYLSVLVNAIFLALAHSGSFFLKSLGLLLTGYVLMFFIENIVAYNLLNVLIWAVAGMCHSKQLRSLNDKELKLLLTGDR